MKKFDLIFDIILWISSRFFEILNNMQTLLEALSPEDERINARNRQITDPD